MAVVFSFGLMKQNYSDLETYLNHLCAGSCGCKILGVFVKAYRGFKLSY
jgi:hypothetical protein